MFTVILPRKVWRVAAPDLRALIEALTELGIRWKGIWDESAEWFEDGTRTDASRGRAPRLHASIAEKVNG